MASRSPQLRGAANPLSDVNIEAIDKAGKALELRKAGLSYGLIAKELGYADASGAHRAVERGLRLLVPKELVEEMRAIELERLDNLWRPMYTKALQGDRLAVDRCLAIMERRSRFLGLDAPLKIQQMVITEEQFREAIDQLNREAEILEQRAGPDHDDVVDAEIID
jgi:hypothetical protein